MNYAKLADEMQDSLMRSFAIEILIDFAEMHDLDTDLITEKYVAYYLKKWKNG